MALEYGLKFLGPTIFRCTHCSHLLGTLADLEESGWKYCPFCAEPLWKE